MTNIEAISALLYPYDVEPNLLLKTCIDSGIAPDAEYSMEMRETTAKATVAVLEQLIVLSSESDSGYSLSYNVDKLEKRIYALAKEYGLADKAEEYSVKSKMIDCTERW